jgi:hypothetical protein
MTTTAVKQPVTEQPTVISNMEELANLLWPAPGPYYALVELDGVASSGECYYRLKNDRWSEPGAYGPKDEPTLAEAIIAASNSWRMRFSPFLSVANASSSIAQMDTLVAFVDLPRLSPTRRAHQAFNAADQLLAAVSGLSNESLLDEAARTEALARIHAMTPQLNVVVDEGERLACIWLLDAPLREAALQSFEFGKSRGVYTMQRLAVKLGQSGAFAHAPHRIRIDCPGVRHLNVKHIDGEKRLHHVVTATVLHENRYTFAELEEGSK